MTLLFVNFNKTTIAQNKIVLDKMTKLNMDQTYQLMADDQLMDLLNHRMLDRFLEDRNIKMDTLGLPLNLVYEKGTNTPVFGSSQIEKLFFQRLYPYLDQD